MTSEAQLQRDVIQASKLLGWMCYSIPDSRRATSNGYPDLTFLYPGNGRSGSGDFFLAELKAENGVLSRERGGWIAGLHAGGVEVFVWRPSDWDEIIARLQR